MNNPFKIVTVNIAAFKASIEVNCELNRFVAKDGLQSIHVASLFEVIERKAMAQVVAPPFFNGGVPFLK
ncbi:MAG: hypothetical protein ABIQ95_08305 [Bdellovibrionia bacterium]